MATNRFEQPVSTPMNVEFYKPNFQAWAAVLGNQQKTFDENQALFASRPEYDQRADQTFFDDYVNSLDSTVNNISDIYANEGVTAGNQAFANASLELKRDMQPGGKYYQFAERKKLFDAFKQQAYDEYEDPRVAEYVISSMYQNQNNAFQDAQGNMQSVRGYQAPAFVSTEDRMKVENDIIKQIQDTVMTDANGNVKAGYRNVLNKGYESVYEVLKYMKGTDLMEALEIINGRFPQEYTDYGKLRQDAYGVQIPQGANRDDFLITMQDDEGNDRRVINAYHPYAEELYRLGDSIDGIKEVSMSNLTLTDHKAKARDDYERENGGIPISFTGNTRNGQTNGGLGNNTNSENFSAKVQAREEQYNDYLSVLANQQGTTPEAIDYALKNASVDDFERMFPGANRSEIVRLAQDAQEARMQYEAVQDEREEVMKKALGEQGYNDYLERHGTLLGEAQWLMENDPKIKQLVEETGYTAEELLSIKKMTSGNESVFGFYEINGEPISPNVVVSHNLQRIMDAKARMDDKYKEAEEIGDAYVNSRLQENITTAPKIYRTIPVNDTEGNYSAARTKFVDDQAREYYSNPGDVINDVAYDRNGNPVPVRDILSSAIEDAGGDPNALEKISRFDYSGATVETDRNGQRWSQVTVFQEGKGMMEIELPLPQQIGDLVKYGKPTAEVIQGIVDGNIDDLETYADGNANDYVNTNIQRAATNPGVRTPLFKQNSTEILGYIVKDKRQTGEPLGDTGYYLHFELTNPDTEEPVTIDSQQAFENEIKKTFRNDARIQFGYSIN